MRLPFIALLFALAVNIPSPTEAQAFCRCECFRTPQGRVCRRICSYPPPRYVPAPQYTPRYDPAPQYQYSQSNIDVRALAGLGLLAVLFVAIAAAITSTFSTNPHQAAIQLIEHDIAADTDVKQEMEDSIRKADAHIAAMLAKYRQGDHHG